MESSTRALPVTMSALPARDRSRAVFLDVANVFQFFLELFGYARD